MYKAMVEKDLATLNRVHADEFVLVHMTGMRQSKEEYINAILDGTLNYYSASHEQMDIAIDGDHAHRPQPSDGGSFRRRQRHLAAATALPTHKVRWTMAVH